MNFEIPNPDGPFPEPFPFPDFTQLPPFDVDRPVVDKIAWPIKYGPAQVKILVVTDGATYDTVNGFGLGLMLQDAFNVGTAPGAPLPDEYPAYARFEFTLETRSPTATPGAGDFVFSDASLAGFHEVWLFGVSTVNPYLQGDELTALTKFMNNNDGGVLAMGDHEDLGLGLCGNVPRVKSMRKWWYQTVPPGELQAPDGTNLTRNDTVQLVPPGNTDPGTSPGQQDSYPQLVYPNYRFGYNWWRPWRRFRYPHPVLCGPRGAIRVFPDHAHEGDCVVPSSLNPTEYPGGVVPEIVARGRNVVGRSKGGYTITDPRAFGLLGAYDGHVPAAGVGRVLVDSTWHHWFNVNLIGLDNTPHSNAYKDILAYFRNVAVWLAPPERQRRMRLTGQFIFLFTQSMIERTLTIKELRPEVFYPIGIEARDALGRFAPHCQVNIWLLDLFAPYLPLLREHVERTLATTEPDQMEAYVLDRVLTIALGGAVSSLAIAARKYDFREGDSIIEDADSIMREGLRVGMRFAEKDLASSCQRLDKAVADVRKLEKR